jgi:hypothetical protein
VIAAVLHQRPPRQPHTTPKGLGHGGRCRNHGGLSTGPKTEPGRQRIAAAQRKRWQARRSELPFKAREQTNYTKTGAE